jgi:hypothetical protein
MLAVVGLVAVLVALGFSLLVTRLATVALVMTGMSREAARFQARSAFTGTGFTTGESEQVVNHPVRRRVLMLLMVMRSAGLVSVIVGLLLTFAGDPDAARQLQILGLLVGGVVAVLGLAHLRAVEHFVERLLQHSLQRWTDLPVRDYVSLLNLSGEYTVTELLIEEGHWLAGKTVEESLLYKEGLNLLGLTRSDGTYIGVPAPGTTLHAGDKLILYGRSRALEELDTRRAGAEGERAHQEAVREQRGREARQRLADEEEKRRQQESGGNSEAGEKAGSD